MIINAKLIIEEYDNLHEEYINEYAEIYGQDNDDYKTEDTRWDWAADDAASEISKKYSISKDDLQLLINNNI